MKLTHSFRIPYDPVLYAALRDYQREAARVWNDTLEEAVLYFRTWKRWASKTLLQANRKQAYRLHSQTVQAIVDKYDECRKGTKEKRRRGDRRARYPWRKKHFFCLPFKQNGFMVEETGEAYTSQDCPFCDRRHQTRTRHFFCPVTKTGRHRDMNGAQNIARRKYPMPVTDVSVVFKQPI